MPLTKTPWKSSASYMRNSVAAHCSATKRTIPSKSSIGQIYQTFGGVDLYPLSGGKSCHAPVPCYQNHSFSDGNKRIAATLFLWFLNGNGILYNEDGTKRIADNTPCSPHSHDSRKSYRGKGHDGQSRGQSHQQEQLILLFTTSV